MLRKVLRLANFDFVYGEVEKRYGYNGNVSVAPPLIVKLMLLLVLYNVRSERELMATLPERLDWLWFLGLDWTLRYRITVYLAKRENVGEWNCLEFFRAHRVAMRGGRIGRRQKAVLRFQSGASRCLV